MVLQPTHLTQIESITSPRDSIPLHSTPLHLSPRHFRWGTFDYTVLKKANEFLELPSNAHVVQAEADQCVVVSGSVAISAAGDALDRRTSALQLQ